MSLFLLLGVPLGKEEGGRGLLLSKPHKRQSQFQRGNIVKCISTFVECEKIWADTVGLSISLPVYVYIYIGNCVTVFLF